jgi:hypothetical protein
MAPTPRIATLAALALLAIAPPRAGAQGDTTRTARDSAAARHDSTTRPADPGRLVTSTGPVASPLVLYSPETGWGGGGGLVWVRAGDAPGQRPTTYQTSVVATETALFSFVGNADIWTEGNRYRLTGELTVQRAPNKFFGIGPYANMNPPEKFVPSTVRLILTGQKRIAPRFFAGLRFFMETTQLTDVKPGPIKNGTVSGGPNGWYLSTLSALLTYDSRDRYYYPLHGSFVTLQLTRGEPLIGSEFQYNRVVVDARWYQEITNEHVIALQAWADGVAGDTPPFERMPRLGGKDLIRGFFQGRYRDRFATAFTAEYRTAPFFSPDAGWHWWRLSGVTFLSTGTVAPNIRSFTTQAFQVAGGVGLRIALTRPDRLNLRIDRGWGPGSSATYFTVSEAF